MLAVKVLASPFLLLATCLAGAMAFVGTIVLPREPGFFVINRPPEKRHNLLLKHLTDLGTGQQVQRELGEVYAVTATSEENRLDGYDDYCSREFKITDLSSSAVSRCFAVVKHYFFYDSAPILEGFLSGGNANQQLKDLLQMRGTVTVSIPSDYAFISVK